jgi:hypothetical protein
MDDRPSASTPPGMNSDAARNAGMSSASSSETTPIMRVVVVTRLNRTTSSRASGLGCLSHRSGSGEVPGDRRVRLSSTALPRSAACAEDRTVGLSVTRRSSRIVSAAPIREPSVGSKGSPDV